MKYKPVKFTCTGLTLTEVPVVRGRLKEEVLLVPRRRCGGVVCWCGGVAMWWRGGVTMTAMSMVAMVASVVMVVGGREVPNVLVSVREQVEEDVVVALLLGLEAYARLLQQVCRNERTNQSVPMRLRVRPGVKVRGEGQGEDRAKGKRAGKGEAKGESVQP